VGHWTGEDLFWVGRYIERSQHHLHVVRATLSGLADGPLGSALTSLALSYELIRDEAQPTGQAVLAGLTGSQTGGLALTLRNLEYCAAAARPWMADDDYRLLARVHQDYVTAMGQCAADPADVLEVLDALGTKLGLVLAAQTAVTIRDHRWRLRTCGRLVERLVGRSCALRTLLDPADPSAVAGGALGIGLLLALFDSRPSWPAQVQHHDGALAAVQLLALDATDPCSLASTLAQLRSELALLPSTLRPEALLALLPSCGVGLDPLDAASSDDARARLLISLAGDLEQRCATVSKLLGEIFCSPPEWSLGGN